MPAGASHLVTDTLRVTEAFRNAIMSHFRRWIRRQSTLADAGLLAYTLLELSRTSPSQPIQFHWSRRKAFTDGASRAMALFRLEFDHEVMGPLCLGHAAHFGLGLFLPDE